MIEQTLREIITHHLSKVLEYNAFERFKGVIDKDTFRQLMGSDPAFAPFFLNHPKYITARVGGNLITSLHRKLGDMYEEIFQTLLANRFKLSAEDLSYNLQLDISGKAQIRSTDGFISYSLLPADDLFRLQTILDLHYVGLAFEIRSCYQIGDSKRIQADRDMALALRKQQIEPVMVIFCSSSLVSPVKRLKEFWRIYEGEKAFDFVKNLTEFDLQTYFQQEDTLIQEWMNKIFEMM